MIHFKPSSIAAYVLTAIFFAAPHTCIAADIYKVVNEDGTVTYTDKPVKGAIKMAKGRHNQYKAAPIDKPTPKADKKPATANTVSAKWLAPAQESTVQVGDSSLTLSVETAPFDKQHLVQFFNRGTSLGKPSPSRTLTITEMIRGESVFTAKVIDSKGKVLTTTPPLTVHIKRPMVKR